MVFRSVFRHRRVYINISEDQAKWDELTPNAKAIILEPHPLKERTPGNSNMPNKRNQISDRVAHLHDISVADYLSANLHELCMGSDGDVNIESSMPENTSEDHGTPSHDDQPPSDQLLYG